MFYYFMKEYMLKLSEKDTLKKAFRNLSLQEKCLIISLFVVMIVMFIFIWLQYLVVYFVCVIAIIVIIAILEMHSKRSFAKNVHIKKESYINEKIAPTIELMIKYDMMSESGIEYLIHCCEEYIENKPYVRTWKFLKGFAQLLLPPVIASLVGAMIDFHGLNQLAMTVMVACYVLLICFGVGFTGLMINKQRRGKYMTLKSNLHYLKSQLEFIQVKKCKEKIKTVDVPTIIKIDTETSEMKVEIGMKYQALGSFKEKYLIKLFYNDESESTHWVSHSSLKNISDINIDETLKKIGD